MMEPNTIIVNPNGTLLWQGKTYHCALGRGGVTTSKKEGDGATPIGRFALREAFYRADRLNQPITDLPISALKPVDGWSDDPNQSNYNSKVLLPHAGSTEHLWRDDATYDIIIVIGYNDQPAIKDLGSAIFIHIAKTDYAPTAGCVALKQNDLLEILTTLSPNTQIEILNVN